MIEVLDLLPSGSVKLGYRQCLEGEIQTLKSRCMVVSILVRVCVRVHRWLPPLLPGMVEEVYCRHGKKAARGSGRIQTEHDHERRESEGEQELGGRAKRVSRNPEDKRQRGL